MGRSYSDGFHDGGTPEMMALKFSGTEKADFIDKMIDTLKNGTWGKGSHLGVDGQMCVEGAAFKLGGAGDYRVGDVPDEAALELCDLANGTLSVIRDVIGAELGMTKATPNSFMQSVFGMTGDPIWTVANNPIPRFNDADDTTKERVIAKLAEVAEQLRVMDGEPATVEEPEAVDVHTVYAENVASCA